MMFLVQLSVVVSLLSAFLVWIPDFSLNLCCYFGGPNCYRYNHTLHVPTFVIFLYINCCILGYILLSFAWHYCPLVLPHPSVCMFSPFLFLIIIPGLFAVCYFCVRVHWFHNPFRASCSHTDFVWVCVRPSVRVCTIFLSFPYRVFCILKVNVLQLCCASLNTRFSSKWGILKFI